MIFASTAQVKPQPLNNMNLSITPVWVRAKRSHILNDASCGSLDGLQIRDLYFEKVIISCHDVMSKLLFIFRA